MHSCLSRSLAFLTVTFAVIAAGATARAAEPSDDDKKRAAAVQAQLDRRIPELAFDGVGIADVIDFLRDVSGANIFVNWKALETGGIDRNMPVTARLRDVKFSKAIRVVLDSISEEKGELDFVVDDGVITISTSVDLATNVQTQTFDVSDLLAGPGDPATGLPDDVRARRLTVLIRLINGSVAPASWKAHGGHSGEIKDIDGARLVVTQTAENLKAVDNLITQLREMRK